MSKAYTNPTTREEAIQQMTPIVKNLARKWTRNHYQDYNDICQCGYMGVLDAYDRFDASKGVRFSTYAWWYVRAHVKNFAENNWNVMNHTASEEAAVYSDASYYDLNENAIDISMQVERMAPKDQVIFNMRQEGYTFDEIAKQTGMKNLHVVRNRIKELEAEIAVGMGE